MHALDVPPEFAKSDGNRKARDFLSASSDIMLLCDIVGGIALGYFSGYFYVHFGHTGLSDADIVRPLLREVMLGSVIAALVLREPRLSIGHELFALRRLLAAMMWRAVAAITILATVGLATRGFGDMARQWLLAWCALFFVFACFSRMVFVTYLHHLATHGKLREAVVVVGAPDVAGRLAARLAESAAVVRIFDNFTDAEFGAVPSNAVSELLDLARAGGVDTVVVAVSATDTINARPIVEYLKSLPVQVTICSDAELLPSSGRRLRLLSSVPMSVVADRPLNRWGLLAKAVMDKIGALLLIFVAIPLMLLAAVAVALDSPGPVLFRQRRSGWSGRLFTIYKFRTMRHEPGMHTIRQTVRNDQRLTRVGSFLRYTSIDELPQLWNVLRGEMSLVGPRPHADVLHAAERAGCTLVAEYAQRQRVKPGLTGWAQIHGLRGGIATPEALRRRIGYDLYYIDNWSVGLDLLILARTPWALLRGENAY